MSVVDKQRADVLRSRNMRRRAWPDVEAAFVAQGIAVDPVDEEEQERIACTLAALDPMDKMSVDPDWNKAVRDFAGDRSDIVIGDPWLMFAAPFAAVPSTSIVGSPAALFRIFPNGFFIARTDAGQFFVTFDDREGSPIETVTLAQDIKVDASLC